MTRTTRTAYIIAAAAMAGSVALGAAAAPARADSGWGDRGYGYDSRHHDRDRDDARRHFRRHRLSEWQVRERLRRAGFPNIYSIRFDDGRYVARGYTRSGRHIVLYVDAFDGDIHWRAVRHRYPRTALSRVDVIALLYSLGYHRIADLDYRQGMWSARGLDRHGHRRTVRVNPRTRAVRDSRSVRWPHGFGR